MQNCISTPSTNQHSTFYRSDVLPVAQFIVSTGSTVQEPTSFERRIWSKLLQLVTADAQPQELFRFTRIQLQTVGCLLPFNPISSMHCCRKRAPLQTASGLQCNNTCVSSAYKYRLTFQDAAIYQLVQLCTN